MDPYLWTWLARYGGASALTALWLAAAAHQGVHRRWIRAATFGVLGVVTAGGLATHLVPLVRGGRLPVDPTGLDVALAAPFAAFAVLVALSRSAPARFDPWTLAPAALIPHGIAAWLLGLVVVAKGPLRGALLVGMVLLGVATFVDTGRHGLREAVMDHGLPTDRAVQVVSAATSGLEAAGWAAMTLWVLRERSSPP